MLYLAVFLLFISLFMFLYGILSRLNMNKLKIEKRVHKLNKLNTASDEKLDSKSFAERLLKPIYKSISGFFLKSTPDKKLETLNKRLDAAGLLKNTTSGKWIYRRNMIILCVSLSTALLSYYTESNILKACVLSLLAALCVNTLFNFNLSKKAEMRKRKILKDLPFTLDLITVSVEAGLSFDGAMERVVENIKGEICDEFAKSLKEIRMGIEHKTALKNMGERCGVRELSMLMASIIQSDDLGVSLSKTLRIEAANLREKRKQAAKEKAMKAPIKILFPLILFIFPTIFIVILGPAIINIMNTFGGK